MWYQEQDGGRGGDAHRHRILLDGVRRRRGAAQLLRRSGHPGRRPSQVRVRPGAAADRGGSVLPLGVLPAVADRRRLAARDLPVAGSAGPAAAAADRRRGRPGAGRAGHARLGAQLHARVWIAQVGRIPLLLLDSDIPRTSTSCAGSPIGCTAATRSTGSSRRSLAGIGGVRAIRAFTAVEGLPDTGGVPHERGPRRFPRRRADPRVHDRRRARLRHRADRGALQHGVHHPHAGARRHRPLPGRDGPALFRRRRPRRGAAARASRWNGSLAFGAEDDPSKFNMAHMGLRLAQRANGVSLLHGEVSREHVQRVVAGIRPRRGADRLDHQRCARADLGGAAVGRSWPASWSGDDLGSLSEPTTWQRLQQVDTGHLWWIRSQLRELLVDDVRARLRRSWLERGASEAELGWIATAFDPDVLTIGFARRVPTYKRLTLMLRDPERLESLLLDETAPAADRRGQVASRRRRRQGADPAGGAVRRPARGAAPDRLPAGLRHVDGAAAVLGLRRLAEQPAAAAGSLRHLGDEERAERRPQPVHPRRLVGRVVRRRKRLGDPDRRRSGR